MSQKTLNLCLERYNFVKFGETTKSSHTVLCINNAYSVNSDKYRLTPTAIASKHGDGYVFTLNYDFDRPLFTIVQKSYSIDGTSGNIVFEGIDPISKGGSKYLRKVTVSPVKLSDGSYLLEVTNDEYLRIGTTGAALGDEELESLNEKIVTIGGIEKSVETVGGKQVLKLDAGGPSGAKEIVYFEVDPSDPPSGIYAAITEALSKGKEPVIRNDGTVYFYSSTGTDKYVFVGGYTKEAVGYTEIEVSDDDSVTSKSVDDKVFNMYLLDPTDPAAPESANPPAYWICDKDKNVITQDALVAAKADGKIFVLNSDTNPEYSTYVYYAQEAVATANNVRIYFIEVSQTYYGMEARQINVYVHNGLAYATPLTEVTLAGTNEAVMVTEVQSFDATQKAQGRANIGAASASDVTALQSQVSSLSDVSAYSAKGEATVAQLNAGPSGIQAGWAYQLTDSGTLTDGTLAVVAGDTVAWDGTKWFPLVKSDYYATKTYAQNVAHSIAPEYVGSTGAIAGRLYMHGGVLYRCLEDTNGDWDSNKFAEDNCERRIALRGNNGSYVLDGVLSREAHFFDIDPRGDYEVELSVTSWTGFSNRANFQFFYNNGENNIILVSKANDASVSVDKTYRLHTLPSMNIKYIGVFINAATPINMHLRCSKVASSTLKYQSKYSGNDNTKVNAYAYNLIPGHTYRLDIDSSGATFNNVTSVKFGVFHVTNGSVIDDVNLTAIPSTYFIKAVSNECYNIGFRCDAGTSIICHVTDVTDDYVEVVDTNDLVWSGYYVKNYDGELTNSSQISSTQFGVDGIARIDIVMGYSTSAVPGNGLAFYDEKFIFISGLSIDGSAAEKGYKTYSVDVPPNAKYCRAGIYNEFIDKFSVVGIPSNPTDYANRVKYAPRLFLGSLQTYISDIIATERTDLNGVHTSELYSKYDELVTNYPQYFSRQADLATVTRADDSEDFVIRSYRMSYNHMAAFDHEPTGTEVVTPETNKWMPKNGPRKLLIVGGMHGEEKTPCWGLMLALTELMTSDHPNAQFIRNNFVLEIVPCLNPAGWDLCRRGNCNNKVLNRAEAENEPETLAYMAWIEANKDAFMLMDFHGTQGRYAYTPVNIREPIANAVMQATERLSAALYDNNATFYASIAQYYADTYKPYIIAKYGTSWERSSLSCRMFQDYGMLEFALETPDNLDTGSINQNDARLCKVTKQLFFNLVPAIGCLQGNFAFKG